MRIVLDTNVLVSAFLSPLGTPAELLTLVLAGELTLLVDQRILDEYRGVLLRPEFALAPAKVDETLQQLEAIAEQVSAAATAFALPDETDRPFIEVALSGDADVIVTGNLRHFPASLNVSALSPRAFLDGLDGSR